MDRILFGVLLGICLFDLAIALLLLAAVSTAQNDNKTTKTHDLHIKSTAQK